MSDGLGQCHYGRFTSTIRRIIGGANLRGHARRINNRASGGVDMAQLRSEAILHSIQIDADDPIPGFVRHTENRSRVPVQLLPGSYDAGHISRPCLIISSHLPA